MPTVNHVLKPLSRQDYFSGPLSLGWKFSSPASRRNPNSLRTSATRNFVSWNHDLFLSLAFRVSGCFPKNRNCNTAFPTARQKQFLTNLCVRPSDCRATCLWRQEAVRELITGYATMARQTIAGTARQVALYAPLLLSLIKAGNERPALRLGHVKGGLLELRSSLVDTLQSVRLIWFVMSLVLSVEACALIGWPSAISSALLP